MNNEGPNPQDRFVADDSDILIEDKENENETNKRIDASN